MAPQMDLALRDHPVEAAVDAAAAAAFAAATGFAASAVFGLAALPSALLAFVVILVALRQVAYAPELYSMRHFQLVLLPREEQTIEELLLTTDMVADPPAAAEPNAELMLDDVLARIDSDSRVVRLFGPGQMPTAREIKSSIDRHLHFTRQGLNPPDATQALSDALAQLRRSLR
jgi:hypothetical protein